MNKQRVIALASIVVLGGLLFAYGGSHTRQLWHHDIQATVFWVGEPASADNAYQHNVTSAWDDQWLVHFGGIDTPTARQRHGEWPAAFVPQENPFYCALPYSEFGADGKVKSNAARIFWYEQQQPVAGQLSILKNRWIRIVYAGKTAYAQWEDVGPYESDDVDYVFGTARPRDTRAGLDISPATAALLGITGRAQVSWQFVEAADVPPGPWLTIVTTRQISYD